MSGHTVLQHREGSLPARIETWLGHLIEIPAAALVVGEVAVLLAGVVMRFVFNKPIPWADELASILVPVAGQPGRGRGAAPRHAHAHHGAGVDVGVRGPNPGPRCWRR